jgi:hypothetical protein
MAIENSSLFSATNTSPTLTVPASGATRNQDQSYRSPGSYKDCARDGHPAIVPAPQQWPRVLPGL